MPHVEKFLMKGILRIFIALLLLFSLQKLNAQRPGGGAPMQFAPGKGAIAGQILDESTGLPISFANILLLKAGLSEMIAGTNSDEEGRFFLKDVDFGTYDLKVSFIGYLDFESKNLSLSEGSRFFKAGKILLQENAAQLSEVEVVAEREMIQFGLDKRVYNATKDLSATGGDALEVLKNIPSVSIDIDGSVSLRGSENVRILINGKPSGLAGLDRRAVLAQIPASMIESIEVMTNPSAKYSPEGMSGIINIITKKQNQRGFNLQSSLTFGTNPSVDGTLNLNYRIGKFNFFTNYNGRFDDGFRRGESFRKTILSDTLFYLNTDSYSENQRINNTVNTGLEYYFNAKSVLGANFSISPRKSNSDGENRFDYFDFQNKLTEKSIRQEFGSEPGMAFEYNLNFNQNFKREGQTLNLIASLSESDEEEDNRFNEDFFDPANQPSRPSLIQKSSELENNRLLLLQADYAHPLFENFKIETGGRATLQKQETDFALFDYESATMEFFKNDSFSNLFEYNEDIIAGYIIANGKFKKFEFQAGIRGEQTYTGANLSINDVDFQNDYFGIFPSGFWDPLESTCRHASLSIL